MAVWVLAAQITLCEALDHSICFRHEVPLDKGLSRTKTSSVASRF